MSQASNGEIPEGEDSIIVRFFEQGEGDDKRYYYERDELVQALDNDNFVANLHERMDESMTIHETPDAVYDRVCVEDPSDGEYWIHWRAEHTPEEWMAMEFMARRCATLLIRQTALNTVVDHFTTRFAREVQVGELYVPDDWEVEGSVDELPTTGADVTPTTDDE